MDSYRNVVLPNSNAHILAPLDELDFFHTHCVELPKSISPLEAWNLMMSQPMPVLNLAFRVRDAISSKFGVKKIGGFSSAKQTRVVVGDKLDFFLVEYISQDVLALSERDQHLDVLTCLSRLDNQMTITSSVKTHNLFGRAYMLPVAPAHKLIVRSLLNDLQGKLSA